MSKGCPEPACPLLPFLQSDQVGEVRPASPRPGSGSALRPSGTPQTLVPAPAPGEDLLPANAGVDGYQSHLREQSLPDRPHEETGFQEAEGAGPQEGWSQTTDPVPVGPENGGERERASCGPHFRTRW